MSLVYLMLGLIEDIFLFSAAGLTLLSGGLLGISPNTGTKIENG